MLFCDGFVFGDNVTMASAVIFADGVEVGGCGIYQDNGTLTADGLVFNGTVVANAILYIGDGICKLDLSAQTLVVYRGETPAYATLVSTGLPDHATPTGVFPIRRKYVAATMANIGADAADDRYRIEDVPWTQYFSGSIALHGAFWHGGFGQQRSHGCVNLSPGDAQRLFTLTTPEVPDGWFGVSLEGTDIPTSYVVVTE